MGSTVPLLRLPHAAGSATECLLWPRWQLDRQHITFSQLALDHDLNDNIFGHALSNTSTVRVRNFLTVVPRLHHRQLGARCRQWYGLGSHLTGSLDRLSLVWEFVRGVVRWTKQTRNEPVMICIEPHSIRLAWLYFCVFVVAKELCSFCFVAS